MIIQLLWCDFPYDSVDAALVVHLHREIASVVVPPELGGWDLPLRVGPGLGSGRLILRFLLQRCSGSPSCALMSALKLI